MKNIIILTSGYQRQKNDLKFENDFVCILTRGLEETFNTHVIAPSDKKSKSYEQIDNVHIHRFKQSFFGIITGLAYGSGIIPNIRKNKLLLFLIPSFLINQLLKLKKVVSKYQIELIHAHWILPQGFVAVLYKKLFNPRIKILVTAHGADFLGDEYSLNRRIRDLFIKFIFNNIDLLTTVSSANKNLLKELGYKQDIYVYPMGVDTEYFSPKKFNLELKEKYNKNGFIILFVGAIIERKGVRYLINAMPKIINKFPNIKLLVMGDGNLKNEMLNLARKLKISDNVIFLGYIQQDLKPDFFAIADLFVFPSLSEGFGLVNIEAMSCGTIPIVSDLEVFKDIVTDDKTGFVIKRNNSKEISVKVINALKNKNELTIMKERARKHVKDNFDCNIAINNYRNLIEKELIHDNF